MLTTIEATYENGQIIWHEAPPVQTRTKVMVTFLTAEEDVTWPNPTERPKQGIQFGSLAGKISVPEDFDEPLDDLKDYM